MGFVKKLFDDNEFTTRLFEGYVTGSLASISTEMSLYSVSIISWILWACCVVILICRAITIYRAPDAQVPLDMPSPERAPNPPKDATGNQ